MIKLCQAHTRGGSLGQVSSATVTRVSPPVDSRRPSLMARARLGRLFTGTPGRPAPLVEVVGLALGLLLFNRIHNAVGRDIASATANAKALQSIERAVGVDVELTANQWLTGHSFLIQVAVYYYRLYYAVIAGVLLWLYLRHADSYVKARRVLVAIAALALPVFWALPMSPPRFALPGVVDIIAGHDILNGDATREIGNGQNHFSAMPSLHVGWSAWCAYAVWTALRASHPRWALLAWAFPLGMVAVVLTTGNHYVLDVVASAVLLVVSIGAAAVWGRAVHRWRGTRSR
jgi:hypothetical protein